MLNHTLKSDVAPGRPEGITETGRRRWFSRGRLEEGVFRWPKIENGVLRLSSGQLSALLEGLDWRLVHEARETLVPRQAG
jgi:transposase